jgi:hypothetical protein
MFEYSTLFIREFGGAKYTATVENGFNNAKWIYINPDQKGGPLIGLLLQQTLRLWVNVSKQSQWENKYRCATVFFPLEFVKAVDQAQACLNIMDQDPCTEWFIEMPKIPAWKGPVGFENCELLRSAFQEHIERGDHLL